MVRTLISQWHLWQSQWGKLLLELMVIQCILHLIYQPVHQENSFVAENHQMWSSIISVIFRGSINGK